MTAYGPDGTVDLDVFRAHVRAGIDSGAAAVFACCGTGEFHALTREEFRLVVAAAVEETAGQVPVVAGAGYGTALAVQYARTAEEAGADGLLAMPPYLVVADQEGLLNHYAALAAATGLETIVYQRDNAVFTPETVVALARTPGIIGLKDGYGDLDLMQRIVSAVRTQLPGDAFLYFNGLPTAELTGLAYRGIGVTLYSSAVFAFAPDIALAFHRALASGDDALVNGLLDHFYRPLVELRAKGRGYAVSLVKAGVRLQGLDVGEVRTPLTEPPAAHVKDLIEIIAAWPRPAGGARLRKWAGVKASAFLYPWDVVGDPAAASRIAELGVQQVTLASAYHSTRALTPRHPAHRIVTAEHAAVLYPPDPDRWAGRALTPYRQSWVAGDDPYGEAAEALTAAGLEVHSWVVLAHSSRLGAEHPDTSVRNAYGDRYPWAPCIARPAVRAYLVDLAAEAAARPGARGTELESCGWYGFAHLHAHDKVTGVGLGDAAQYALSLCFCAECRQGYGEAGADPDELAAAVRRALEPAWSGSGSTESGWGGVHAAPRPRTRGRHPALARPGRPYVPGVDRRRRTGRRPAGLPGAAARRPRSVPHRRQRRRGPGPHPRCGGRGGAALHRARHRTGSGARAVQGPHRRARGQLRRGHRDGRQPPHPGAGCGPRRLARRGPTAPVPRGAGLRTGPGGRRRGAVTDRVRRAHRGRGRGRRAGPYGAPPRAPRRSGAGRGRPG